jgi:hypothetical protein
MIKKDITQPQDQKKTFSHTIGSLLVLCLMPSSCRLTLAIVTDTSSGTSQIQSQYIVQSKSRNVSARLTKLLIYQRFRG